jgi:Ni/Co efflux regulator RcnB
MRRILFTILACTAMSAAVPAAALAHDGQDHHHKRHHHVRVRHEHFVGHRHHHGQFGNQPTAGTVTSFANNVLMITLTNGNTVSGLVTDQTEVKCENPEDIDNNGDNGNEHSDRVTDHGPGGGDNGDRGDDNGNRGDDNGNRGDDNDNMCTTTPGMAVRNAELRINGAGASWDEVELIPSTSSTQS